MLSSSRAVPVSLFFWGGAFLIQVLNWGEGAARAIVLTVVLLVTLGVTFVPARQERPVPRATLLFPVLSLVFLAAQMIYAGVRANPHLSDMAFTSLAAGRAIAAGQNPYLLPIDPQPALGLDHTGFDGYKYLPLTALVYLPLGSLLGARGVQLTNLLLELGTVWAVVRLSRRLGAEERLFFAAALFLSIPLVPFQLFATGAPDLAGVLPLLAALLFAGQRNFLSGLSVGLSLSAKLLPAALFLPICLPPSPRSWPLYGAGILLGLVPTMIYAVWAPHEVWRNIILFNLVRSVDSTSWRAALPAAGDIVKGLWFAVFTAVTLYCAISAPPLKRRIGLAVVLILVTLLSGPIDHTNYQLWWLPLFAVLIANWDVVPVPRGLDRTLAGDEHPILLG